MCMIKLQIQVCPPKLLFSPVVDTVSRMEASNRQRKGAIWASVWASRYKKSGRTLGGIVRFDIDVKDTSILSLSRTLRSCTVANRQIILGGQGTFQYPYHIYFAFRSGPPKRVEEAHSAISFATFHLIIHHICHSVQNVRLGRIHLWLLMLLHQAQELLSLRSQRPQSPMLWRPSPQEGLGCARSLRQMCQHQPGGIS